MSKVKVSDDLTKILKNFSTINKSIVIEPGNVVSTLSVNKNILAKATVTEEFSKQVAIYDLGVFLGGVSLFDAPLSVSNFVFNASVINSFLLSMLT